MSSPSRPYSYENTNRKVPSVKAKTIFLSLAVLVPLHVARAAMRVSVSMLSARDTLQGKVAVSTVSETVW